MEHTITAMQNLISQKYFLQGQTSSYHQDLNPDRAIGFTQQW